jgi:RNA polymerase-interacting CarD/CdnL/TRCF family regulator
MKIKTIREIVSETRRNRTTEWRNRKKHNVGTIRAGRLQFVDTQPLAAGDVKQEGEE